MDRYKIEFLKDGNVIDHVLSSYNTIEEIEKHIISYKKNSYCREVSEAENIEWRIIEIIEQVVKKGIV